jgi:integrase
MWRVQVRRRGFHSESATFRLKGQADAWAIEREGELVGSRHGIVPQRTVRQAVERYMADVCPKHEGRRWELLRLAKILRSLPFADRGLQSVSKDDVAKWRDGMTLAPSSCKREYGLLRAVFSTCIKEWGWLKDSPFRGLSPPKEGKPRKRRISDAEADAIVTALGYVRGVTPETASQFVAAAFLLGIETAMRKGEMLSLEREQVNGRIAHLLKTKNGDERDVPLSKAALAIIDRLPTDGYIFPIALGTADTLFRKARDKVGLQSINFHDSRREGTTRLAAKVYVLTLAKITGHKDVNLLLRVYYAPRMEDVAARLD